jgi:hypothetical protein
MAAEHGQEPRPWRETEFLKTNRFIRDSFYAPEGNDLRLELRIAVAGEVSR